MYMTITTEDNMPYSKKEIELSKKLGVPPLTVKEEKKHKKMMDKYRKIWKERGCIHWEDKDA